tara:strand:- start:2885 stop:3082 length:198 start_codon:yes stop_codon:yes gene_type:complete
LTQAKHSPKIYAWRNVITSYVAFLNFHSNNKGKTAAWWSKLDDKTIRLNGQFAAVRQQTGVIHLY